MGHLFVVCAVGIKMTNETGVALMCRYFTGFIES